MNVPTRIKVTSVIQDEGYRIFDLLVSIKDQENEYKIYASDQDIPLKGSELTTENLESFAREKMEKWLADNQGDFPKNKFLLLVNDGSIPTDDIENHLYTKKKISDLIRTNVTISAPLFEWAKVKAQQDGTSFSELVSRGLRTLKDSGKESDKGVELWVQEQGGYFKEKLGDFGSLEVFHYLPDNDKIFTADLLKEALQNAELNRTGWPIGAYLTNGDGRPHPQEDGIKAEYSDGTPNQFFDYWYAKNKGEFYFARTLESDSGHGNAEPKTTLYFDTLVWRVAEALEHCLALYKNLGISEAERVKIQISLYELNNRFLGAWNPLRAFTLRHYTCGSDKSSWEIEIPLKKLEENLDETIYEGVKKLLLMFDFFVPNKEVVLDILNREYRKSRM